jgi:hypothetical protein
MDEAHLKALLSVAGTDEDGLWLQVKDDRTITLHTARQGVGLNISKVRKLRTEGALLYAQNAHGDTFVVALESVFAGSVDPLSQASRTAGFR